MSTHKPFFILKQQQQTIRSRSHFANTIFIFKNKCFTGFIMCKLQYNTIKFYDFFYKLIDNYSI